MSYKKTGGRLLKKRLSSCFFVGFFVFLWRKNNEKPLMPEQMKKMSLCVVWMLVVLCTASAQSYMFKHLEVKDGLSNNQVNAIYKDSDGYMWFATASGLNRYDGYDIRVYRSEPGDSTSLPDNFISSIQEDGDGFLWIQTGKGYARYNPATENFSHVDAAWMRRAGIGGAPSVVYIDSDRTFWVYLSASGQLFRYVPGEEKAVPVPGTFHLREGDSAASFSEYGECLLLVDAAGVLHGLDRQTLQTKWREDGFKKLMGDGRIPAISIYAGRSGRVWVYCEGGMGCYDLAHGQWEQLRRADEPFDAIRAVLEDKDGRVWLGKDQKGIEIVGGDGRSVSLVNSPEDVRTLSNNTIDTFYEDEDGTIWVGTYKKGISYYNESAFKFSLAEVGDVHCIEDGGNGTVWLGTNGEGLIRRDVRTGSQTRYRHIPGDGRSVSSDIIVSLLRDSGGRLWAGTYYGGLNCYDGHRFTHYRRKAGVANSLASDNVWALAEDKDGNIWIGMLGGGLQCLEPRSGRFTSYHAGNSGLTSDWVSSLCVGRKGQLFVGTTEGVFVLDLATREAGRLQGARSGRALFASGVVNQVYEDSRARLWVATMAGLKVYDPVQDSLYQIPVDADFPRQPVLGLAEDGQGYLWASVGGRLVCIWPEADVETGRLRFDCRTYSDRDGLQACDFNQRSLKRLETGEIVAGGLYGINMVRPGNIRYNGAMPRVMFTGLQLFNEEVKVGVPVDGRVVLAEALDKSREIVLDYEENVFTVFLATDNYVLPEKTRYYYKLEGFNEDWLSDRENLHRVTYTNLAPGTYRLRVKAANNDGVCSEDEASLKIVIRPPFWLTPWAYLLYALLLAGGLWWAYVWVKRRERNKYRMRQLEEDARRKDELNQMKFRFFTNVSHELRTPLTLILSPLESLVKEAKDEKLAEKLKMMHRNALRLLNLVNQLLDFRKNEMAGLRLSLSEGDLVSFVRNICDSFLMLSEKKDVRLAFSPAVEGLDMAFDADKVGKVVMNLLSNAFKFTPEGGRVEVAVEVPEGRPGWVEIRVADTGIGISDADKVHVFERFYQAEHTGEMLSSTGSGIGLSLVRDFVSLHGGTVGVADNPGGGSVFTVAIPVKHVEAVALPPEPATGKVSETESSVHQEGKKPLVLVVDDSRDFVDFMKDTLDLYFTVRTAANGQEALELLARCKPDLILCDLMMPVMDGKELCRRLKSDKRTANIPFVLLTARQSVEMNVEGLSVGADDYVTKPFNVEVLVLRMRKLIDLSRKGKPRAHIDPEPSEITVTSVDEKLVADAIAYVEKNMARSDLSVEELSRELGMSRAHLYKKISQITGKTPIEFIRIIRLKRAAQLLRESQQNVSEIAYQVGFNNPKYFSRYFKEEFGVLPSVYQEKEGK